MINASRIPHIDGGKLPPGSKCLETSWICSCGSGVCRSDWGRDMHGDVSLIESWTRLKLIGYKKGGYWGLT
jgi:hypothetical protein